jgi:hypothetical protein
MSHSIRGADVCEGLDRLIAWVEDVAELVCSLPEGTQFGEPTSRLAAMSIEPVPQPMPPPIVVNCPPPPPTPEEPEEKPPEGVTTADLCAALERILLALQDIRDVACALDSSHTFTITDALVDAANARRKKSRHWGKTA